MAGLAGEVLVMSWLRSAALVYVLFGLAVPLSANDDEEGAPAPRKDEKKSDDKKSDDKKSDDKKGEGEDKPRKATKLADCEYYPLAVGTTWVYEVNGQLAKMRVVEHEEVRGVLCARLENEVNGTTVATEHLSVKEDGVYRHSYNGTKIDPPLLFMKLPFKKGATWKVKSKQSALTISGTLTWDEEDDVDVPLGTFKTVVVKGEFETAGQTFTSTSWFVKGKGLIKQTMDLGGGNAVNLELKKFKLGEGKVVEDEDEGEGKKPEGKKPGGKKAEKKDEEAPKNRDF
jgi:hypothetical protein